MPRLKNILWLELYAVLLAFARFTGGVHTDEAKYLLDIPYPHPPLIRSILHLTDSWVGQEIFWRIVFASILVQSVWLLLRLAPDLRRKSRIALCVSWLFGSAILLQAGSIMMAPLTAFQALLFLCLYLRDEEERNNAAVVAFLWLISLFTAYQIILFFPIVWALLRRSQSARWVQALCFLVPIALVGIYSLSNPLTLASVLIHGDSSFVPLSTKLWELTYVWFLGGSIVLSIAGLYGILRNKLWPLLLSFVLVAAYVYLARFPYYAILFLPLSIAGLLALLRRRQIVPNLVTLGVAVFSFIFCLLSFPSPENPARRVMQALPEFSGTGVILINGDFGHEWQYESSRTILRYRFNLLPMASAVVCLKACTDLDQLQSWRQIMPKPPLVYVKR